LYKLSREKVNGKYGGDITAAFKTAVERIEEAVMKAHTSEYIAHHVFFNPALVDSVQQGIEMAAPVTCYEHTKAAAKFVTPSEIHLHTERAFAMDAFSSFKARGLVFTET
jgi:hypothetical protein